MIGALKDSLLNRPMLYRKDMVFCNAYDARYNEIVVDIPRKTKCVDNTVIQSPIENIKEHECLTLTYYMVVGENAVI